MNQKRQLNKISEEFLPQLKNKNKNNSQFLVVFSGKPGSGKTTVAKKLEEKYKAVRINSDLMRKIINNKLSLNKAEGEKLIQEYNEFLIKTPPFKNKFIILDKSMDRQYKKFFSLFKKLGLDYFVIRMEVPKEVAIQRRIKYKGDDEKDVRQAMEKWEKSFKDFGKKRRADIILDGENIDFKKLVQKLEEKKG